MCGRVVVKSSAEALMRRFSFAQRLAADESERFRQRYNGAPRQLYPIIVREPDFPGGRFVMARWGFIPSWSREENPKVQPINARSEGVAASRMFGSAYRSHRALMPIDGFFEWRAIKGSKSKQPYAIAMKSGEPFCVAAIWSSRGHIRTGAEETFCILTCEANELVGRIHDRMPVIIAPEDYHRWIGDDDDPSDLLRPYPAALMTMWPVSTRVNSPRNDDPGLLDPIEE